MVLEPLLGNGLALVVAGVQLVAVLSPGELSLRLEAEESSRYDHVVLHKFSRQRLKTNKFSVLSAPFKRLVK